MPDLPQNSTYDSGTASKAILGASIALGKVGRAKRATITPAMSSLASRTSSAPPAQSQAREAVSKYSSSLPAPLARLGAMTTPYGGSTKYEGFHPGIDVANVRGTPIPFVSSGTVVEVVTGKKQGDPGYGNYVKVRDEKGNFVKYAHADKMNVRLGQKVSTGQVGLTMGNSGSTYSLHGGGGDHLDIRFTDMFGKYFDPYSYFRALSA